MVAVHVEDAGFSARGSGLLLLFGKAQTLLVPALLAGGYFKKRSRFR